MAFVHEQSCECTKSELDLFSVPPTQTSMEQGSWIGLFSQVDVSLNGTLITASTNTYPYRAMIETLLSYGEDAKRTQLTSALFYKDRAGRMDLSLIHI